MVHLPEASFRPAEVLPGSIQADFFLPSIALDFPGSESIFFEQPDHVRVVRDLSTVEELELMLAMSSYALQLLDTPENLTKDQLAPLMEAYGKQLRANFIARHGYRPEDSTTSYVPVTFDGPQYHDAYYAKEYP